MSPLVTEDRLAFYMGYAFSRAIHIEHVLEPNTLMVPFITYWRDMQPHSVPYPSATQAKAVAKAHAARAQISVEFTGWSSGREGALQQNDGTKLDVLYIEGWVASFAPQLEMLVYYRKEPFRLIKGFFWKPHPTARKNAKSFMAEFKNGIFGHPFGQQSLEYIERAEQVSYEHSK